MTSRTAALGKGKPRRVAYSCMSSPFVVEEKYHEEGMFHSYFLPSE